MPEESETGLIWVIKGQNLEMNWGMKLFDSRDVPDGVGSPWEKKNTYSPTYKSLFLLENDPSIVCLLKYLILCIY